MVDVFVIHSLQDVILGNVHEIAGLVEHLLGEALNGGRDYKCEDIEAEIKISESAFRPEHEIRPDAGEGYLRFDTF